LIQPASHPFDSVAAVYDSDFTHRPLGRMLRARVWEEMERLFAADEHILELGCGTGEDALHLAQRGLQITATDASPGMLEVTADKLRRAGLATRTEVDQLDLGAITSDSLPPGQGAEFFDGAFSNFGALNCQPSWQQLGGALHRWVRPGGKVLLVVMGPLCPWEIAAFLLRLQPGKAARRWRAGQAAHVGDGHTLPVWYPTPRRLRREFSAGGLRLLSCAGLGVLLPPSFLAGLVERHLSTFERLDRWERRLAGYFPFPWLGDHYMMILERPLETLR